MCRCNGNKNTIDNLNDESFFFGSVVPGEDPTYKAVNFVKYIPVISLIIAVLALLKK